MKRMNTGPKPMTNKLPVPGGKTRKPSPCVGTKLSKIKSPKVR